MTRTFLRATQIYCLIGIAVFLRVWHLGNIPACNGDEAWLGWKALRFLHHQPFAWKTATGNFPDPFYFFPLVGLHAFFTPSFTLLRVVAVASGVLALPLNFFLCRRVFGKRVAWFSTLLLAALPANIAYSRFGWEPSQMLPASLFVVYFSLLVVRETSASPRWLIAGGLALSASFLVHPMCAFLAPFPFVAAIVRWPQRARRIFLWRAGAVSAACWLLAALILAGAARWKWPLLQARFGTIPWLKEAAPFGLGFVRLFSGTSTYLYLAGDSFRFAALQDGLAALLIFAAVACLALRARSARKASEISCEIALLLSAVCGAAAFFVVVGSAALEPASARYGLWMIGPGVLLIALAASQLAERAAHWNIAVQCGIAILCWLMMAGFRQQYFGVFETSGGRADPTFQTARIEPKQAALELILSKQKPQRPFVIASGDWWIYWPVKYLAADEKNLTMLSGEEMNSVKGGVVLARAMKNGDAWFLEFSAMRVSANLKAALKSSGVVSEEYSTRRADGAPVVMILHPLSKRAPANSTARPQ